MIMKVKPVRTPEYTYMYMCDASEENSAIAVWARIRTYVTVTVLEDVIRQNFQPTCTLYFIIYSRYVQHDRRWSGRCGYFANPPAPARSRNSLLCGACSPPPHCTYICKYIHTHSCSCCENKLSRSHCDNSKDMCVLQVREKLFLKKVQY